MNAAAPIESESMSRSWSSPSPYYLFLFFHFYIVLGFGIGVEIGSFGTTTQLPTSFLFAIFFSTIRLGDHSPCIRENIHWFATNELNFKKKIETNICFIYLTYIASTRKATSRKQLTDNDFGEIMFLGYTFARNCPFIEPVWGQSY